MGLVPHDLFDAAPLLEVGGLGDAEQRDAAAGMLGAARGKPQRHFAFGRLVDDDKEFARVIRGRGGTAHGGDADTIRPKAARPRQPLSPAAA